MIKELIRRLPYKEYSPFKLNQYGYGWYVQFELFGKKFFASIREYSSGIVAFIEDEESGYAVYKDNHMESLTKTALQEMIILWLDKEISFNTKPEDDYFDEGPND